MKKLMKFLLGGVAALVLLALVVPFFVPAETYKTLLVEQVRKMTGRELTIAGNASLKLLPNVALHVENVSLANPAGFTDSHLAKIGALSVNVALKPLLSKRLEMKGVLLENAEIALEERADGIKSWEVFAPQEASPTKESKASKKTLNEILLGNVAIKNTAITFRKAGAKTLKVKGLNLDMSGGGFSSPLRVKMDAQYQDAPVSVSAVLANPKAFMEGTASPLDVGAKAPGLTVTFKGEGAKAESFAAMGALDAQVTDLPQLTKWATGKAGAAAPKSVSAKGTLKAAQNRYGLSAATITVDGIKAVGDIAATLGGKVPSLAGSLAFGALDMDTISGKSGGDASSTASSGGESGWSSKPLNLKGLRAVNAALALSAESVKSGKLNLGKTSAKVNLAGGDLRISDIATRLYDGGLSGSVRADGSGKIPAIGADMKLSGVQIEKLMMALSGKSRLAGAANLSLNLHGVGPHMRAIVSSLGGTGSMKITDGAILGINLGKFLRDAKKGFLADSSSERTDFAELSGTFAIASGVVSNKDLAMKAPLLRLAGEGSVNLPAKTIKYLLKPKLVASGKGQEGAEDKKGIVIPLRVEGPWSSPSITPDLSATLEETLKDPEALKKSAKNIGEEIKQYNSKDDLKKALGDKDGLKNLLKGF